MFLSDPRTMDIQRELFFKNSGLKHITPKYSENKIWAVKNSGNSVHTSVFGGITETFFE